MFKCKSSNIDYLNYDPTTETLEVCFTNGTRYSYYKVSQKDYDAFEKAESHGKHFFKHVRDKFKFQKQDDEEKRRKARQEDND